MTSLINKDFIKPTERLKNLGARPVWLIKQYEGYYTKLNNNKRLIKKSIFKVN